ncbi:hypothetical protein KCU93_g4480, partial [Aureobasidium melanogenum]
MATNEQEAAEAAFVERMRNFVSPNPSPRNPRINRESSFADMIEEGYQADGHKTWGYVIYRTTYESDADWADFMQRLRWWTKDTMEMFNGQNVLDRMTWTVFDDRERFDGADTTAIRRHFRAWVETAVQSEQQSDDAPPVTKGRSPRYRYCIQVDADALDSCVHGGPPPPYCRLEQAGWVKIIDKNWLPRHEDPKFAGRRPAPHAYDFEPIDGVTEEHVGWLKCPLSAVMTEYYYMFRDLNGWSLVYQRPPEVIGAEMFMWLANAVAYSDQRLQIYAQLEDALSLLREGRNSSVENSSSFSNLAESEVSLLVAFYEMTGQVPYFERGMDACQRALSASQELTNSEDLDAAVEKSEEATAIATQAGCEADTMLVFILVLCFKDRLAKYDLTSDLKKAMQWAAQALKSSSISPSTRSDLSGYWDIPRVWWIRSGVANSLPFHAATDGSQSALDYMVPSYTPIIKALQHAHSLSAKAKMQPRDSENVFVVTMLTTPGESPLPGVVMEKNVIKEVTKDKLSVRVLESPRAEQVLQAMNNVEIMHFACHGVSDPLNPADSHLLLQHPDGTIDKLTVSRLIQATFQHNPRIAYLSACSTAETKAEALVDESLHLTSAFQIAGFIHVVGSMWASDDITCASVAEHFYKALLLTKDEEDQDRAVAMALWRALRKVKADHPNEHRWTPYVHFGA